MVNRSAIALVAAAVATLAASPPLARADTLVFPVEGAAAGNTRLTRALLAGASGAAPRLADTPLGEAASLLECRASDRACLDSVAQAMEADTLLTASVRPAGGGLAAHITYHRRGQAPLTRDVDLPSDPEKAAPLLERQVRALLRGESAPAAPAAPPSVADPPASRQDAALGATAPAEDTGGFSFRRVRPWAWAIAGGGLVLVGVGSAFAIKAGGLEDDVESAPRETVADLEHLKNLEDQGESATTMSNVLFIAGGVTALAGTALILWQGMTPTSGERGRTLGLAPAPLRGGAALVLSGELPW